MADLFPARALGECLDLAQAVIIDVQLAGTVAKGDVVARSAAIAGNIDSVIQASANAANVVGVALKGGVAGDIVPILLNGIVKVAAVGAITGGSKIKAAAAGKVQAAVVTVTIPAGATTVTSTSAQPSMTVEGGIAIGRALQTFADGDTGLVFISFA